MIIAGEKVLGTLASSDEADFRPPTDVSGLNEEHEVRNLRTNGEEIR